MVNEPDVIDFPCMCGAQPGEPCVDEHNQPLRHGYHMWRFTGGAELVIVRDSEGNFYELHN